MSRQHLVSSLCIFFFLWSCLLLQHAFSQVHDPFQTPWATQADYVIITPSRYVQTVKALADFRQVHNGFTAVIATTEEIYGTFGQHIPPDSAIRNFISFTLTGGWSEPVPKYFLLAGNVDAVPSHMEPGLVRDEDSVCIDQWFVEGVPDTTFPRPAVAIGRFPARDSLALATMVSKTLAYERSMNSAWFGRAVVVADYGQDFGNFFEAIGWHYQQILGRVWSDTVTVHVEESSTQYATRSQFLTLCDQGAAVVSLVGRSDGPRFSDSEYFTSWDVDSIAENSPLAFCMINVNQRFERTDTVVLAVSLLEANTKGAVVSLAPSGLAFSSEIFQFHVRLLEKMASDPNRPIGNVILDAKRMPDAELSGIRRQTLLGDPAIVVKSPLITGIGVPPPTALKEFGLNQNYPNPFNPTTTIPVLTEHTGHVRLRVFNLFGEELALLHDGILAAGEHRFHFDGVGLPSGVYRYQLEMEERIVSRSMLLLR